MLTPRRSRGRKAWHLAGAYVPLPGCKNRMGRTLARPVPSAGEGGRIGGPCRAWAGWREPGGAHLACGSDAARVKACFRGSERRQRRDMLTLLGGAEGESMAHRRDCERQLMPMLAPNRVGPRGRRARRRRRGGMPDTVSAVANQGRPGRWASLRRRVKQCSASAAILPAPPVRPAIRREGFRR